MYVAVRSGAPGPSGSTGLLTSTSNAGFSPTTLSILTFVLPDAAGAKEMLSSYPARWTVTLERSLFQDVVGNSSPCQ